MNKAEANSSKLEKIRWLWFIPSAIMYTATEVPLGKTMAVALCAAFGLAFYGICSKGRMFIIGEDIVNDMRAALDGLGQRDSVFEIKNFNLGLVVRVYLIKAREMTPICNKVIMEKLNKGWYNDQVWITQVVDLEETKEVNTAQKILNEALVNDIREKSERKKRK